MNVKISRLSNGLIVITDPMPQLESAVVGVWVNCGARNESRAADGRLAHARAHGVQGHAAAQRARHRRGDRSGRRFPQRLHEPRADRVPRARAEGRCAAGARHPRRHSHRADLRSGANSIASARWCCRRSARRATRPTTSSSIISRPATYPDQPMGWPILGEEETVSAFTRDDLSTYMGANYRAGGMTLIASGAVEHDAHGAPGGGEVLQACSRRARGAACAGALCRRRASRRRRSGAGPIAYAFPGVSSADPDFYVAQVYVDGAGRRNVVAAVSGSAREARPLLFDLCLRAAAPRTAARSASMPAPAKPKRRKSAPSSRAKWQSLAETATDAEVARAKAQLRSGLLMGLERPARAPK